MDNGILFKIWSIDTQKQSLFTIGRVKNVSKLKSKNEQSPYILIKQVALPSSKSNNSTTLTSLLILKIGKLYFCNFSSVRMNF